MTVLVNQGQMHTQHAAPTTTRLLVTRKDPATNMYRSLGFLSYQDDIYSFAYLASAVQADWFEPLPGLQDVLRAHESSQLFPIFAERVMSARRPDREVSLSALGLALDAAPFEVLRRSGGRRVGDTIELVPAPIAAPDGFVQLDFLVHGVRYIEEEAQQRITSLRVDETLRIVHEPRNLHQSRAMLVTDTDEMRLGYVPDPLLDMVHNMRGLRARVLKASGPQVGFHLRLLACVEGYLPTGSQPFSGPDWATVPEVSDDHFGAMTKATDQAGLWLFAGLDGAEHIRLLRSDCGMQSLVHADLLPNSWDTWLHRSRE